MFDISTVTQGSLQRRAVSSKHSCCATLAPIGYWQCLWG